MEQSMTGRESQAMSAEQSAGSAGREVESEEQSELEAEGQVSGAKQFVHGAKRKGLRTEQSAGNSGQASTARSAPGKRRRPSDVRRVIRERGETQREENGAIRTRNGAEELDAEQSGFSAGREAKSPERSGRNAEGQVSNTKQFVSGAKR
jgi:hypothetical protein